MTSQSFLSSNKLEAKIIGDMRGAMGRKPVSVEIFDRMINVINEAISKNAFSRDLMVRIRLAMKAHPYSEQIPALQALHHQVAKNLAEARMPVLLATLNACRAQNLPVPVIMSCKKYMDTALALQLSFGKIYDIPPVIIRGDADTGEEIFDAPILSLPVADTYEALPAKVFETYVFLQALGNTNGLIKIDDDLKPVPDFTINMPALRTMFAAADYQGMPVGDIFHDRAWHSGKCSQTLPDIYAKPIKSPWARGALYFLSHNALEKLAPHYMRFPGCLDGEYYEDKAVCDVLFDNGIRLTPNTLEAPLGLDSRTQVERG